LVVAAVLAPVVVTASLLAYAIVFPRQPFDGELLPLTDTERDIVLRLEQHVRAIARTPRNLNHYPALERAAVYIETELARQGHTISRQSYEVEGREVRNIEVTLDSPSANYRSTLVIGAHYDTHANSPGANDNGTGVAALIEIARLLGPATRLSNRVRLVFFVNEEVPFGRTEHMGSLRHARKLSADGERVSGMIALETIGFFSQVRGSQRFPFPFGLVYADIGNFVAFVGLPGARGLVRKSLRTFRSISPFPSIGGIAPRFVSGVSLSDHWAYAECGFPALMITDTAPFRNPFYHTTYDLPHTADYQSLARITLALSKMIRALAD